MNFGRVICLIPYVSALGLMIYFCGALGFEILTYSPQYVHEGGGIEWMLGPGLMLGFASVVFGLVMGVMFLFYVRIPSFVLVFLPVGVIPLVLFTFFAPSLTVLMLVAIIALLFWHGYKDIKKWLRGFDFKARREWVEKHRRQ